MIYMQIFIYTNVLNYWDKRIIIEWSSKIFNIVLDNIALDNAANLNMINNG